MPIPSHYKQVIARVIERDADKGLSPVQMAEAIIEGLGWCDMLLTDGPLPESNHRPMPAASSNVLIKTPVSQYREPDLSQGLIIGGPQTNGARIIEEAPPTAVVRNPDSAVIQDTYEEVEHKKALLQNMALNTLPVSMTIEIPGVGQITLSRHVRPSPQGTEFVRVLYAQDASEEDGPQVNLFTSNMQCDAKAIKADIVKQAEMRYRKNKPRIEPRMAVSQGFPDTDELTKQALKGGNPLNRTDDMASPEDIKDWDRLTALPPRI